MQSTYLHEAQGARNPKETQHPEEGELWDLAVRKDSEHLRYEDFEEGEEHDRAIKHVPVVRPVAAAPDEGDNQAGHQWQSMALSVPRVRPVAAAPEADEWKSMVINGNQWPSMAINGHQWQWPSMAIDGNQWHSMAINGIQWQSVAPEAEQLEEHLEGEEERDDETN